MADAVAGHVYTLTSYCTINLAVFLLLKEIARHAPDNQQGGHGPEDGAFPFGCGGVLPDVPGGYANACDRQNGEHQQ